MRRLSDPTLSQKSIGVVTFSSAQQRLIEDLMDDARRKNPQIEKFFTEEVSEPVFIKNLENVQGDERDVMFFSICYGPDAIGKTTLSFGPLNRKGGERRLNVAVTRARELLVVYSTLRPDHIAAESSNPAVLQLKKFLDYAARGPKALLEAVTLDSERGFGSPFEREVYDALVAQGWQVHTQVGVGGFFIDLAVVDPKRPGAYLLGIECDGAAYHSAKSARDRDRIRQSILENLGWRIHRIWSTDWWTHRNNELTRLQHALENAKLAHDKQALKNDAFALPSRPERNAEAVLPPELIPAAQDATQWPSFVSAWRSPTGLGEHDQALFYDYKAVPHIEEQLKTIARQSSPVLLAVAARHIANAWGFSSTTKKVVGRVSDLAAGLKSLHVQDDILWVSAEQAKTWKGFRHHENESRDVSDIPDIEILEATLWLVERAVSIERDTLVSEVSKIFGFQRAGRRIQENLHTVVDRAIGAGRLREVDGKIRLAA
ncbi:MAG: AAA domain-containing protein [bacterium]